MLRDRGYSLDEKGKGLSSAIAAKQGAWGFNWEVPVTTLRSLPYALGVIDIT